MMGPQWPTFPSYRKKVVVFGSRVLDDPAFVERHLNKLTYNFSDVAVVSGTADGADKLGEWWAFKHRHTVVRFHPDYDKYGKIAPLYRNLEMAQFVGANGFGIAFWDGQSTGTAHMIRMCRLYDVKLRIVRFK